jgi:hypothetical protein
MPKHWLGQHKPSSPQRRLVRCFRLSFQEATLKYACHPIVILALAFVSSVSGQILAQQSPYVVGGSVSGFVTCADTNAPARFAKVLLKSTVPNHTGEDFMKSLEDNMQKAAAKSGESVPPVKPRTEEQKRAMANAAKGMNQATDMLNASTVGLDGGYNFAGIKPGTYYVHAIFAGYIDPFSQFSDEDFTSSDPAVRARIAQIPTITVNGTDAAHVDLRLERGAAISGRILFDDGSPAAGWTLSVIKPKSQEMPGDATNAMMTQALAMSGAAQLFKTDDLGRYRISGLAEGEYALRATLTATAIGISATNIGDGGSGISLAVYSGDTFSRADAKSFKVNPGGEHPGIDITIPAHSLHNITGHVYAKADSHTLNMGMVGLTIKDNAALHLKAAIRDDGSFHFEYLPSGVIYTVTVEDAADGRTNGASGKFMGISIPNQEILHKYGTDTTEVTLGDADIDNVRLIVDRTNWTPPVKKAGAPDVNPGDLLNGLFSGTSDDKPKPQ